MKPERIETGCRVKRRAFTLIELLVVIAIIALLMGILLPSLGAARESAKTLKCKINMRSIDLAMNLYREDFRGWGNEGKNYGARFDLNGARYTADDEFAYWGVFYDEYIGDAFEVWQDPNFSIMDPYPFWGTDLDFIYETQRFQTYGINKVHPSISSASFDPKDEDWRYSIWGTGMKEITGRGGVIVRQRSAYLRPISRLQRPNDIIVFQDAFEHAMDNNGDTLNNLTQYDSNYGGLEDYWEDAYFRHNDKCHAMFADGHIEEYDRVKVTDDGDPALLYNYTGNPEDIIDTPTQP